MEKFWWSGETQADVGDAFAKTMKAIAAELNRLLADFSFGGKVEQWAFIPIIREEDSPAYDEVIKKSSRGKTLEFRLKIPHAEFFAGSQNQRISLILHAFARWNLWKGSAWRLILEGSFNRFWRRQEKIWECSIDFPKPLPPTLIGQ